MSNSYRSRTKAMRTGQRNRLPSILRLKRERKATETQVSNTTTPNEDCRHPLSVWTEVTAG